MDNYRITVGVEPTDKYEKARQDLNQALKSFSELTPQEKERLLKEYFGAANVAIMCDIFKKYFG